MYINEQNVLDYIRNTELHVKLDMTIEKIIADTEKHFSHTNHTDVGYKAHLRHQYTKYEQLLNELNIAYNSSVIRYKTKLLAIRLLQERVSILVDKIYAELMSRNLPIGEKICLVVEPEKKFIPPINSEPILKPGDTVHGMFYILDKNRNPQKEIRYIMECLNCGEIQTSKTKKLIDKRHVCQYCYPAFHAGSQINADKLSYVDLLICRHFHCYNANNHTCTVYSGFIRDLARTEYSESGSKDYFLKQSLKFYDLEANYTLPKMLEARHKKIAEAVNPNDLNFKRSILKGWLILKDNLPDVV